MEVWKRAKKKEKHHRSAQTRKIHESVSIPCFLISADRACILATAWVHDDGCDGGRTNAIFVSNEVFNSSVQPSERKLRRVLGRCSAPGAVTKRCAQLTLRREVRHSVRCAATVMCALKTVGCSRCRASNDFNLDF